MFESEDARVEIEPANKVNDDIVREWTGCISGNEITKSSERKPQIQKVPLMLLNGETGQKNRHCYEPAVVSLGPYHHNRDDLSAAEKFKLITFEEFCFSCGNISMASLYNKVFEVVHDARKCYIDGSTDKYNDDQFNQMMLHDGCFVLFYIDCMATRNSKLALFYEYLGSVGNSNLIRDIFLLENQIPFIVLQVLLDLKFPADRGEEILHAFFNHLKYGKITMRGEKVLGKMQPLHLLELYRSYCISFSLSFARGGSTSSSMTMQFDVNGFKDQDYMKHVRSVTELREKGIYVKHSSNEIKFYSHCIYGELELVQRAVFSGSKAIYLNMIAYEMCPHNPNDFRISTYISIMKSLVIHPDDVEELRRNNILLYRGQDAHLVKMYDEIELGGCNVSMSTYLLRRIEEHCNNRCKTFLAELVNVYFTSPGTTAALVVGAAGLFLSLLQTQFTIRPVSSK